MSATLINWRTTRTRARASLSTDRRDSATMVGDRRSPRAAVGGLGADDVILDSARTVQERRSKPDDRSELTKLLRERQQGVASVIPLAKRQIGGAGWRSVCRARRHGERMNAAYPAVVEFSTPLIGSTRLSPKARTDEETTHESARGRRRSPTVADITTDPLADHTGY
jgi:hypothetical protein